MVPGNELEGLGGTEGKWGRRVIAVAAALAVVGTVAYGVSRPAPGIDVPPELPEFSLPLLAGKGELDSDQLAGHPTVLNFWASWCAPCREETPLLEKTWRSYKDRGVRFVGVNLRDASANAKDFVRKFGVSYPVVVDNEEVLAQSFGVDGLPQTLFINADGEVVSATAGGGGGGEGAGGSGAYLGAVDPATLRRNLESLLASPEEG